MARPRVQALTPYPYQLEGAAWLRQQKVALLADEMGLGKTVQAIEASSHLKRIAVVCPAVARYNWQDEFENWSAGLQRSEIALSSKHRFSPASNVLIASYDGATDGVFESAGPLDVLICDESHNLKSPDALRTNAIFGSDGGLVRRASRLWCLSGTPTPNHAAELWPFLSVAGATRLRYEAFADAFCNVLREAGRTPRVVGTQERAIPALREILAPLMLRRMKRDVLPDLPALRYSTVTLPPGKIDFAKYYPEYAKRPEKMLADLDADRAVLNSALSITAEDEVPPGLLDALHASSARYRRFIGLLKCDAVIDMVRSELDVGAYDKIIIFAYHTDVIDIYRKAFADFGAVFVDGRVKPADRQEAVKKFQELKQHQVFIGQLTAAGTNITLTAASNVLLAEQSYVPADNAQAIMRAHRITQKWPVFARFAQIANDPLEMKITRIVLRKTRELGMIYAV